MEAGFCVEALEEAIGKHGKPEIFNSDQGSHVWTAPLGQGLFRSDGKVSGAVMSPACSRGI
jgi:hypothetical protein